VFKAIENVKPIGTVLNPIGEMEGVSAGALPDLGAFLPRWVKHLARRRPPKDEWESDYERWLREAVFRFEGVSGLERLARKTKRPQTCLAWCEALVDRGDWAGAFTRTTTARCSWPSRIGVVNFWMVRRWPPNN
jgi:hypothetical protein